MIIDLNAFGAEDDGHAVIIDGATFRLFFGSPVTMEPGEIPVDMGVGTRHVALGSMIMNSGLGVFVRTDDPLVYVLGAGSVTTDAPGIVIR